MSQFIDTIMERPLSHRIGFWVVSLCVVGYVFWQYSYAGKMEELTKLRDSVEQLSSQVTHERRLARDLPRVRKEVKQLDVKLKMAMRELPDKKQIPDLLASISDLASDAGLQVSLFKPKAENYREFYAEVPVMISVEGTYHQVATFFDEVGRLSRIVNINQIVMREPAIADAEITLKSDCISTTFRYLDESERIQHVDKGSKKGRRRR